MLYSIVVHWHEIGTYRWQLHPVNLLMGLGIYSVSLLMTATIWAAIIGRFSRTQSMLTHIRLWSVTNLAQRLPTPIPYVGARTEAYAGQGVSRADTLTAMSLELVVTLLAGVLVAVLTLPFGPYMAVLAQYSLLLWLVLVPLILFVIRPDMLVGIFNLILVWLKRAPIRAIIRRSEVLAWVSVCVVIWLNGGALYYVLAASIYPLTSDDVLRMINVFAVSGVLGWIGQILFFVPNFALRQIAAAYLLSFFVPWPVAVAISILTRLCVMVFELAWAIGLSVLDRALFRPGPRGHT